MFEELGAALQSLKETKQKSSSIKFSLSVISFEQNNQIVFKSLLHPLLKMHNGTVH
jgi:hypothetical protein